MQNSHHPKFQGEQEELSLMSVKDIIQKVGSVEVNK